MRGIDLDIQEGEFCVFVGPSGCGKSTLLRTIAGLEDTDGGTIAFDGEPMARRAAARRATSPWCSRTTPSTRT